MGLLRHCASVVVPPQNVIRRCTDADECNSASITREIRSHVSALVLEGLKSAAEPEWASREDDARGGCDASPSPSPPIVGHVDGELGDPSRPTGRDDTATPGEIVDARCYDGGPRTEWDGWGVEAASSLATAARAGSRVGKGEEHMLAEAVFCGDGGKGQVLEGRVDGGWCDAWSPGQGALRGGGGDAELWTTVLVASGWRWAEVETLLEVWRHAAAFFSLRATCTAIFVDLNALSATCEASNHLQPRVAPLGSKLFAFFINHCHTSHCCSM